MRIVLITLAVVLALASSGSTQEQPQSANTVMRFSTGRDQGLGDALPAGTVRSHLHLARKRMRELLRDLKE